MNFSHARLSTPGLWAAFHGPARYGSCVHPMKGVERPHPFDLPLSTIDLLREEGDVSAPQARDWALSASRLGFGGPAVTLLLLIEGMEPDRRRADVVDALRSAGAWRDSLLGRLGVRLNLAVHGLLQGRAASYESLFDVFEIATALQEFDEPTLTRSMRILCDEFGKVGALARAFDHGLSDAVRQALRKNGLEVDNPRAWLLMRLREAGIIDGSDRLMPAEWGP